MPDASANSVTLCGLMKNEAPYIVEWVAYHKAIGFDQIWIYSNDSSDGSDDILAGLAELGHIKLVPWPNRPNEDPQHPAYEHALKRVQTEWICFLDADEFFNLRQANTIQEFLAGFAPDVSAIGVNWRLFGSGGQEWAGPGLVIERFTSAARPNHRLNRARKWIARAAAVARIGVHRCFLKSGRYVDEIGKDTEIAGVESTAPDEFRFAQINHYFVKSKAEYERKAARGVSNYPVEHPEKYKKYSAALFEMHDLNHVEDVSILRFRDATRTEHARLTSGLAAIGVDLASVALPPRPQATRAMQLYTLVDADSGRVVSFDDTGAPLLASGAAAAASAVLLCGPGDAEGALVWLPAARACRVRHDGSVLADATHVLAHEKFAVLPAEGGRVRLRGHWAAFLRVRPDGNLDAAAESPAVASLFVLAERAPDPAETIAVLGLRHLNKLLRYDPASTAGEFDGADAEGGSRLAASRPLIVRIPHAAAVREVPGGADARRLSFDWLLQGRDRSFVVSAERQGSIPDASIDFIHHEAVLQRLDQHSQWVLLAEAFRILRPGGIHRFSVPSLREALRAADFARGAGGLPAEAWPGDTRLLPCEQMIQDYATRIGYDRCFFTLKGVSLSVHFSRDTQPANELDARFGYLFVELVK